MQIPYKLPEQGIMIETPAAVMISDELAGMVDFFNIGTNLSGSRGRPKNRIPLRNQGSKMRIYKSRGLEHLRVKNSCYLF